MTISRALSSATSGLAAAALRASIASNNIANANSPGYVRRDLVVAERAFGGVLPVGISRAGDAILTADRRIAEASANRADVIANTHIQLSQALGDPESGYGLFNAWSNFETTLNDLSVTPESAALQNALLLSSQDLAREYNQLGELVTDQRVNADAAIDNAVDLINANLKELHAINRNLIGKNAADESTANMLDRREQLINEISRYIPVKTVDAGGNQQHILTKEGVYLLSETVSTLEFSRSPTIVPGDTYGTGSLSGLTVNGTDITPGSGNRFAVQSGALAGYFETRDVIAPGFQSQLDALAADLISRFEDSGVDPTLNPGDAGLFTDEGGALDPGNMTGLAQRLAINAAVDPDQGGAVWRLRDGINAATEGASGNAGILNAMIDAAGDKRGSLTGVGLPGQFDIAGAISEINSVVGSSRTRAESTVASAMARADILATSELSATAVDTDSEMQTLLMVEQAYAANARVIQTIQDMMRRLLEL